MSKTVYIGHAVGDEHGNASGGEAGNQNGRELRTEPWYLNKKGWIVLRPKSLEVAKKIAYDAKAAANNMHIGYDQKERNTLYAVAEKVGFDCAKVTTDCECDCSALVKVCVAYAGIKVGSFNTASEVDVLMKTGQFDKFTDPKYTEQSDYLRLGDILVTKVKGHTAVVISDGDKARESEPMPQTPTPTPTTDAYVLVLGSVRVRESAPNGKCITIAHKGDKLSYLGQTFAAADGTEWYHVSTAKGNGYISAFTNRKRKYTKLIEA